MTQPYDEQGENEDSEVAPISAQTMFMVEAIRRSNMRLKNAAPEIKRKYAAMAKEMADKAEEWDGITEGLMSGMSLILALLDLNSPEETNAFIGVDTEDDVAGFVTVCRGISAKLTEWAVADEAQGKGTFTSEGT